MSDASQHIERLRLVLEGTRLGLWDWNPQSGEVVFDERWAEMLGYSLGEISPSLESWSSRVHPDDIAQVYADIQAHIEGRTAFYENVHRMRHRDGHWVHILDRGRVAERDEYGRPIRFTGTHTDISAQREAEFRALELARGRTRFLATMSHEIRTPMHGILGLLEVLGEGPLTEEQQRVLGVARRAGEGLVTLVNDILDFAKASEGALRLSVEPFHLGDLLDEVESLFRERLAAGVSLIFDAGPNTCGWVAGDGHRLKQVLVNLIGNAVKFTHQGVVLVVVEREGDDIWFRVSDTGRGIADTSRIFQPYDQDDVSISRQFGGTGLGLAIVKHLVDLFDGSVEVESTLGVGSTFRVRIGLPAVDEPRVEPALVLGEPSLAGVRVLVAEDNAVNRMVVEHILGSAGAQVTLVADGLAAVDTATRGGFDVVVLDLNMPRLNGDAALIRMLEAGVSVPAVAATADALPATRDRCFAVGFAAYISKPFQRRGLLDTIQRVVADAVN